MARKGRKRRPVLVAKVNAEISMQTLDAATVGEAVLVANSSSQRLWVISADLNWDWKDATAGDGPIQCGVAHGDYSVTEINEWFDSGIGLGDVDMIVQEKNSRKCRDSGTMSLVGAGTDAQLNDGNPKRTKLGFYLGSGDGLTMWVRNGGTELITGSEVVCTGQIYYRFA